MYTQSTETQTRRKDQVKITCIERKYKITTPRVSYTVIAKKELDEDITEKLLHEDMELKTFLANYEITNVMLPVQMSKQERTVRHDSENDIYVEKCKNDIYNGKNVRTKAKARRELIDFLDLPEEFTVIDYKNALEANGIKISNTSMPYDDIDYLEKVGKVSKVGIRQGKNGRNVVFFRRHTKGSTYMSRDRIEEDRLIQSIKDGQRAILGTFIG